MKASTSDGSMTLVLLEIGYSQELVYQFLQICGFEFSLQVHCHHIRLPLIERDEHVLIKEEESQQGTKFLRQERIGRDP